jgi:hypothetical protein
MGIKYYPDHVQKKRHHVVDVLSREERLRSINGGQDLTGNPLTYRFSPLTPSWRTKLVALKFSSAVSKTYSINIETGRGIITGLNDSLWIDINTSGWAQKIILAQGFYNGTELSAQVKTALEANSVFSGLGLTFTVTYSASTDKFTITPSSGTIQYYDVYTPRNLRRNSTAGHVLGFTADQSAASLVSDTAVPSLGNKTVIAGATGVETSIVLNSAIDMSVDEALSIDVTAAVVSVEYCVTYETLGV